MRTGDIAQQVGQTGIFADVARTPDHLVQSKLQQAPGRGHYREADQGVDYPVTRLRGFSSGTPEERV